VEGRTAADSVVRPWLPDHVLNRFNISFAALTMNKALGLSATAYGIGAGAFLWSYVLFQLPANLLLHRQRYYDGGTISGINLWLLPEPVLGSRHRFKYSLFHGYAGHRTVSYDNERGK
jgi:hypothetical protein